MKSTDFSGRSDIIVRAYFVSERISLRDLEHKIEYTVLGKNPLIFSVGEKSCAVVYRYGTLVCFGLEILEEEELVQVLKEKITKPLPGSVCEEVNIQVDPEGKEQIKDDGMLSIPELSSERLHIVANIVSKSVVLKYYETIVSDVFDQIEPISLNIKNGAQKIQPKKDLNRYIGNNLLIRQTMIGLVGIEDKPEILWEESGYEKLYLMLEEEYELRERHQILEKKMELISETASTLLEIQENRNFFRIEIYILLFIGIEILLAFYDLFLK